MIFARFNALIALNGMRFGVVTALLALMSTAILVPTQAHAERAYYRDGGSGYSWLRYNSGRDNDNGYSNGSGSINRPHRSDWQQKLAAQRKWDEQQFQKMQQSGGAACGLSNPPSYCYTLTKPAYPPRYYVVRY